MTREKYDEIWQNIVLPVCNELYPKEEVYIKLFAKDRVYKEYQKKKTYLKVNYMQNPKTHLDRHKIAACMMYAIAKVRPVAIKPSVIWDKFIKDQKFSQKYSLINEYIGLYTAFSIVESFRIYEEKQSKNKDNVKRHSICKPITTNGEDYIYNTCLDLYLSRKKKNINVLTFANVFFLLETGTFETEDSNKQ
ncbi:MAG: hypothetical protein IKJ39_05260 [Lachnospiraceae bacterium]|nr:hypothetical protein [Lachnospiraceae bacterium]MBR3824588.1 hypothetical protein [Lachnospiraceae bacterium]